MSRTLASGLLLLATIIWGFAFVAQKSAMDHVGPLTYAGARFVIGGLLLVPFALWELRRRPRPGVHHRRMIAVICIVFFLGAVLQQVGLSQTTVTNSGFLTALYVLVVPVLAFVALRAPPQPIVWIGAPLAVFGVYWLNGGGFDSFNTGDLLVIVSALFWGVHVLLLGLVSRETGLPVTISAITFLITGILAGAGAFVFEAPSLEPLLAAWPQLAYAAILSTAFAFTLQAIAQQYAPPSNAAIILSAESLFAALGGAIVLGERLPPIGYAGAALIVAAILVVEALPPWLQQRRASAAARKTPV